MSIGEFMAGAGNVGTGMRQAEQEAQIARMRQLAIQEENRRVAAMRESRHGGLAVSSTPAQIPHFSQLAAGAPAGQLTPEQLAEAKKNLPPEDYAILAYGQRPAAAPAPQAGVAMPGQQPVQPTAQPTTEQVPTAPTPQPQAGLAAPVATDGFKPVLRGEEAAAMQQQLQAEGFPMTPGQGQVIPPPENAGVRKRLISPANSGITEAQLAAMSPEERAQVLQAENDYRNFTRGLGQEYYGPVAGAADVIAAPVKLGYSSLAALGNLLGVPRLARALGIAPRGSGDIPYPNNFTQFTSGVKEWGERRAPLTAEQMRGRPEKPVAEKPPAKTEEEKAVEAEVKDMPKGPAGTALAGQGRAGVSQDKAKAATAANPSTFYTANPESIISDRINLDNDYQKLRAAFVKRAEAANWYGQTADLQQLETSISMLDQQYRANAMMLEGMAAVAMFEYAGDPSALGTIMSQYLNGTPVGFNRRDDGMWDLFIGEGNYNGTYSTADISHMVKQFTDVNYRQETAKTMSEAAMLNLKNQLETRLALTKIEAETLQKMIIEGIRGQNMLRVAEVGGKSYQVSQTQDGEVVLTERNTGQMYLIDPRLGQVEEGPGNLEIQVPPAVRGVNIPR